MQNSAGQVFLAGRRQYMQNVSVVLGGQAADGTEPTSFHIRGCDVFVRAGTFQMRPAAQISQTLLTLKMGVQTGEIDTKNLGGVDGGSLYLNSAHTFTCNLDIYGSSIVHSGGNLAFANSQCDHQIFGGSTITFNSTGTLALANNATENFYFMNSVCTSTKSSASLPMFSNIFATSLEGSIFCMNGLAYFINSTSGRPIRKVRLSGTTGFPVNADIRFITGGTATEVIWSGTAPEKIDNTSSTPDSNSVGEYWGFDCKVVDDATGLPLSDVPVLLTSDINPEGHFIAMTEADGNVVFENPATLVDNNVLVRNWYGATTVSPPNTLKQDRTYTLTVNGLTDFLAFPPNQNFETQSQRFQWPGRERDGAGGYEDDGGDFQRVMTIIRLRHGRPQIATQWSECELP